MADVEAGLSYILSNNSGVVALAGDRIFPLTRGNCNTYPAIVYRRIDTQPFHTHDQASGLEEARFQINSFGKSFISARQMANAVKAALNGWNDYAEGVHIRALFDNERHLFENETGITGIAQDYMVMYR